MQTRHGVLLTFGAGLLLFAVACSGSEEPKNEASDSTPATIVTRSPEDATSTALQPVNTGSSSPEPVATATAPNPTSEPISPSGPSNEPPATTASAGGTAVEMGIGTYCWGNLCVDKIGSVTRGTLQIAAAEKIDVAIPGGATLRSFNATAFPAGDSTTLQNGDKAWQLDFERSVTLVSAHNGADVRIEGDLDPGTYVLTVGMFFESGDVQYGVVLEVQ